MWTDVQMHNNIHTEAQIHTTIMQKQNIVPAPYAELCVDKWLEQSPPFLTQNLLQSFDVDFLFCWLNLVVCW